MRTRYCTAAIQDRRSNDKVNIFYRIAGDANDPCLLLLHGFPSSSHQFRGLIDRLSNQYRVIAPDLPGFGFSEAKDPLDFEYSFAHLAEIIEDFLEQIGVAKTAMFLFDYGAEIGFRLAVARPDRITAIISHNGNAYAEGLGAGWTLVKRYWEQPTAENRTSLSRLLWPEITEMQYRQGEQDSTLIAPESYTLDQHFLERPHSEEIQISLLADYETNLEFYPKTQHYFRDHQPKTLVIWSKHSPVYDEAGADGFVGDLKDVVVERLEAGHFALETHLPEIVLLVRGFLGKTFGRPDDQVADQMTIHGAAISFSAASLRPRIRR